MKNTHRDEVKKAKISAKDSSLNLKINSFKSLKQLPLKVNKEYKFSTKGLNQ